MKCATSDFGRIENTCLDHIAVNFFLRVVAVVCFLCGHDGVCNYTAVDTCVCSDLTHGCFESAEHDFRTGCLVAFEFCASLLDCRDNGKQRRSAACDDTLFDSRSGCVESVFDAEFLLFHFDFGCRAYADNRNAACEFCNTLLEFLFVVFGCRFRNLSADGSNSCRNVFLRAVAADDRGVVLVNAHGFCSAEHIESDVFKLVAEVA